MNRATRKSCRVRGVESRRAFRTLSKALQNGFRIGELHHVEPSLNSVTGPAGTTRLEPKVMQVLVCLATQAGQVVPKERLMRTVWPDTFVGDDVLTRCISELRRVFGDDVKNTHFIQTIPKSGYRLMAPVSFTSPDANGAATTQPARTETLQSRHDGVAARAETERAPIRPRASLRSWKRGLATMAVVAAVLLAGVVVQRMADAALCQSRPLGPAHLYRAGRLSLARGGLVPSARHRGWARVLHADDRERADARPVLSGRRRGRPLPNAAESAVPRERVAGRVAPAGPRL